MVVPAAHLMSATPIKGNLRSEKGIMNEEHPWQYMLSGTD
jgi:hypothetical protein